MLNGLPWNQKYGEHLKRVELPIWHFRCRFRHSSLYNIPYAGRAAQNSCVAMSFLSQMRPTVSSFTVPGCKGMARDMVFLGYATSMAT